jgi:hypothetical protein
VLCAALFALTPVAARAEETDITPPNGGFEDGTLEPWTAMWLEEGATAVLDKKVAHTGNASIRFDGVDVAEPGAGVTMNLTDIFSEHGAGVYRFEAYFRCAEEEGFANILFLACADYDTLFVKGDFDAAYRDHRDSGFECEEYRINNREWTYISVEFDEYTAYFFENDWDLAVMFQAAANTFWVDDIRIIYVGPLGEAPTNTGGSDDGGGEMTTPAPEPTTTPTPEITPVPVTSAPEPTTAPTSETAPVLVTVVTDDDSPFPVGSTATVSKCYFLNVRKGPGTSHKAFTTVARGDVIIVLEYKQFWVKIATPKATGWVYTGYLTR